jgi:membrane protein YdbS with pleckstrin-like domain
MECPSCGREVSAGSVFCPQCGARVTDGDDTSGVADQMRAGARSGAADVAEKELWSGSYSAKALFGQIVAAIVITVIATIGAAFWNTSAGWMTLAVVLLVLWAALALTLAYRRLTVRYRLTTYRFFHERGLLSRVTDRLEVIDIDDVTVRQGMVERMLGVGTIVMRSSDCSDPKLSLPGIDDVKTVADMIDNVRRAERRRRGLHIESI